MKKKLFSCVLAAAIGVTTLAAFAGCGGTSRDEFLNGGGDATENIKWDVDLSKPIEIRAAYPETGTSGFSSGNTDTAKIIEETTGYKVAYFQMGANADNDVNNWLTTKEKYHIIKCTSAQFTPYLEQGAWLDLTSLLENTESGKKLKELIGLMDYGWDSVTYTNEKGDTGIYAVPDFGYCMMEDSALIWNKEHLKRIGFVDGDGNAKTPETLTEVTECLQKCQELFGASNDKYHAFGLTGSNACRVTPFMSAFDCPIEFYVDDNGDIQLYIFDESMNNYTEYMFMLKNKDILADDWQNETSDSVCAKFAEEKLSCAFLPYWWVTPLVKQVVKLGNVAPKLGITNDYQTVHDNAFVWHTRVRGDGYTWTRPVIKAGVEAKQFSAPVQEKARLHGGDAGVSYYTCIPKYMAEDAVYIIDFLAKKMEHFAEYYGGREGVHWNKIAAPAGAKTFYEAGDESYKPFENFKDKIIYMSPYSYEFQGETKSGGGYWIQLTDRYIEQIVDNSQYCNGTNSIEAKVLFHLRETGFDAWPVVTQMDETVITNPMTMSPPFKYWSHVNIVSRTKALRGIASAIDSKNGDASKALDSTRNSLFITSASSSGQKFFYWHEDIVTEMTKWYKEVKLGITE